MLCSRPVNGNAPDARQVVLIGERTGASFSPGVGNRVFADFGIPLRYRSHDISPAELPRAVGRVREPGVAAANVTMPYKARAAALADVRDADAERVGATNFLVNRAGMLPARNPEVGAGRVARRGLPSSSALLLGAGGAGAAALGGSG